MVFLAYFGPETTVPLASVLATAVGFMMMMGRGSLRTVSRTVRSARHLLDARLNRRKSGPHLRRSTGTKQAGPHSWTETRNGILPNHHNSRVNAATSSTKDDESTH